MTSPSSTLGLEFDRVPEDCGIGMASPYQDAHIAWGRELLPVKGPPGFLSGGLAGPARGPM